MNFISLNPLPIFNAVFLDHTTKTKRSLPNLNAVDTHSSEQAEVDAIFSEGSGTCQSKFWRCVGTVVQGGMKHGQEPGGYSG